MGERILWNGLQQFQLRVKHCFSLKQQGSSGILSFNPGKLRCAAQVHGYRQEEGVWSSGISKILQGGIHIRVGGPYAN